MALEYVMVFGQGSEFLSEFIWPYYRSTIIALGDKLETLKHLEQRRSLPTKADTNLLFDLTIKEN